MTTVDVNQFYSITVFNPDTEDDHWLCRAGIYRRDSNSRVDDVVGDGLTAEAACLAAREEALARTPLHKPQGWVG